MKNCDVPVLCQLLEYKDTDGSHSSPGDCISLGKKGQGLIQFEFLFSALYAMLCDKLTHQINL